MRESRIGDPSPTWELVVRGPSAHGKTPPLGIGSTPPTAIVLGDFDGDGRTDVAANLPASTICFWFGAPPSFKAGP